MVNILDAITGMTGQQRTAALRDLGRSAEYYVPPELRGILGFAAEMTPSETLNRAAVSGGEMLAPGRTPMQRVGSAGRMLSETAGVAAPIAAGPRAGMTAAQSLQEGLLGFSMAADDAGRRFVERMNQPGPVPTMYSNPFLRNVDDYAGSHRAPRRDPDFGRSSLDDPRDIFGGDDSIYSSNALQYYGSQGGPIDVESMAAIKAARGNPDAEISVYRAIPKDIEGASINAGDWVTPSRKYAETHGESALGGDYQIVEQKVRAGDLFTEGDINEWGFDPKEIPPTLPAPRNEAEAMAKQVLEMRAAGRAGDVTEEMMAATDPQYMFANTPLPMDEASRMRRAISQGFDVNDEMYRGDAPRQSFETGRGQRDKIGVTMSTRPDVAASYIPPRGEGGIYPLVSRGENDAVIEAGGQNWNVIMPDTPVSFQGEQSLLSEYLPVEDYFEPYDIIGGTAFFDTNDLSRIYQGYGADRVRFNDLVDRGGSAKYYGPESSMPSDVQMVANPANVRSRFARFDPAFAHLRNLSAGVGGLGLLSLMQQPQEPQ